jgi:hypothetical protein
MRMGSTAQRAAAADWVSSVAAMCGDSSKVMAA